MRIECPECGPSQSHGGLCVRCGGSSWVARGVQISEQLRRRKEAEECDTGGVQSVGVGVSGDVATVTTRHR